MKKSMVLLVSVLVLTACAQPKKEAKESTENDNWCIPGRSEGCMD